MKNRLILVFILTCSLAQASECSLTSNTPPTVKMEEKTPKTTRERIELLTQGLALGGFAVGSLYAMYSYVSMAYKRARSTPLKTYLALPQEVVSKGSEAYKIACKGEKLKWLYSFLGISSATSIGYTNAALEIPQRSLDFLKRAFASSTKKTSIVE